MNLDERAFESIVAALHRSDVVSEFRQSDDNCSPQKLHRLRVRTRTASAIDSIEQAVQLSATGVR